MQTPLGKLDPAVNENAAGLLSIDLEDSYTLQSTIASFHAPVLRAETHLEPCEMAWEEFMVAYLRNEWASKYPFVVEGVDRAATARQKFLDAETDCATANQRWTGWDSRPSMDLRVFSVAKRLIAGVLGRFDADEVVSLAGFGPGASTSLRRRHASQQNKWVRSSHITREALPWFMAFRRWAGCDWLPTQCEVVPGNHVTTVPKNSKTDRVIAIEPDWNMFFQKGVGAAIRRRLQRRAGQLTPDAQFLNKDWARLGSITADGSPFATIDLSSASDSVSLGICEALLPSDWFKALLSLRSAEGVVGDSRVLYEKISSMGNGFTFELETLLFWGIAKAVSGTHVRVYGDDIIVPTASASAVIEALQQAGFSVNHSKTFTTGPFRESCGGHYFDGRDVTPFYLRHPVCSMLDVVTLANQISDWSHRYGSMLHRDPLLYDSWQYLYRQVPVWLRGPRLVEGCLHANWDECRPHWKKATQSYVVKTIERDYAYAPADQVGGMLSKLWMDVPDLEASFTHKAKQRLRVGKVHRDRDVWSVLPAWSLCH